MKNFLPMPGRVVVAPLKDQNSAIVLPETASLASSRFYVVAVGDSRLSTPAGFIDNPLKPGMEVAFTATASGVQPDPAVQQFVVNASDILCYRSDEK
jgi:co-chaperonin GroES (HSP10)